MDRDSEVTEILFPGLRLDYDWEGLCINSYVRVDNEFILEVQALGESPLSLVFGWEKESTSLADMCEETLLAWKLSGEDNLQLAGAEGKPFFLLYKNKIEGICIPRTL